MTSKKGLLERLSDGVVIGDGGMVFALEKRGYVDCKYWTPEVIWQHPQAVKELHREFARCGSDVLQAFTFYARDDRRDPECVKKFPSEDLNESACNLAKEVAADFGTLVCGSISKTTEFALGASKKVIQNFFRQQVNALIKQKVDFLICEYIENIVEMEWAIEVCKSSTLPVAATLCIGPLGDIKNVSAGECAIRMAKAGADLVGVNCLFGPFEALKTLDIMKDSLNKEGLTPYLMAQPSGFHTPDGQTGGYWDLPEFPFALEPRLATRWDFCKFAREAYKMGVRYIGGCCGTEPYHIRAIASELAEERGKLPVSDSKEKNFTYTLAKGKPYIAQRSNKQYWCDLQPATGRPFSPTFSQPQNL